MARRKYTEAQARAMVKDELLWRKPINFPRPGGGYYGDSDSESGTAASVESSNIDVEVREDHLCYLLTILPVGK